MEYEFMHSAAVKVLKWNIKDTNIPKTIIIFRLHHILEVVKEPITRQEIFNLGHKFTGLRDPPSNSDAFPFCNSKDPHLFKYEFDRIISSLNLFQPDNSNRISALILKQFYSCFYPYFSDNPISLKIVLVIDIYRTRVKVQLPAGVKLKDYANFDRNKFLDMKAEVGEHLDFVQGVAFSQNELKSILWTLCHRIKTPQGYLISANLHADCIDRLSEVKPAIKMLMLGKEENHDMEDQICSICWEQFCKGRQIVKMPCFHIFHKKCIFMWLHDSDRGDTCPCCRSKCKTSILS